MLCFTNVMMNPMNVITLVQEYYKRIRITANLPATAIEQEVAASIINTMNEYVFLEKPPETVEDDGIECKDDVHNQLGHKDSNNFAEGTIVESNPSVDNLGTVLSESPEPSSESQLRSFSVSLDEESDEENQDDVTSLAELLKKWKLDEALASKFNELCKLGVMSFRQMKENSYDEDEKNPISKDILNSGDEEKDNNIEEMSKKICVLRKQIAIAKSVLKSIKKETVIEEANFSNMSVFSLHCLGLTKVKVEYQHMVNMLIATAYGEQLVETGIDYQRLRDLHTILKWNQIDHENISIRISEEKVKELHNFIKFFNKSLSCTEENSVRTAAAVMLNFLSICPFEPETNQHISCLLFNITLKNNHFPYIIFPMDKDEKFIQGSCHAMSTGDFTSYLAFIFQTCMKSLEAYLELLKKELVKK